MKLKKIDVAVAEAQRFLERVAAIEALSEADRVEIEMSFPTKEVAALKRASMDLTRALTDMRKP